MSNPQSNSQAGLAYGIVTFVCAVVTVLLGFYLVGPDGRDLRFGLGLTNLLVGEILVGTGFAMASVRARSSRSFIGSIAGIAGRSVYLAVALFLVLLTAGGASEQVLVVLHTLLLLTGVVGAVGLFITGSAMDAATGAPAGATPFLADLKVAMRKLADRAHALPASLGSVKSLIKSATDDVQFTYAVSDQEASSDDAEIRRELESIDALVGRLEANAADTAALDAIAAPVGRFRAALARRNDAIKLRR